MNDQEEIEVYEQIVLPPLSDEARARYNILLTIEERARVLADRLRDKLNVFKRDSSRGFIDTCVMTYDELECLQELIIRNFEESGLIKKSGSSKIKSLLGRIFG